MNESRANALNAIKAFDDMHAQAVTEVGEPSNVHIFEITPSWLSVCPLGYRGEAPINLIRAAAGSPSHPSYDALHALTTPAARLSIHSTPPHVTPLSPFPPSA